MELATAEWVHLGTGKRIYCCNDSHLTVANGGDLTIQNRVVDPSDSVPTTEADAGKIVFRLINGGTIKDEAGNTIYATYTKDGYAYDSEKNDSKVYGTNTVLYFGDLNGEKENIYVGGSDSRTVSIRGTFARLAGFVWVLDDRNDPDKGETVVYATFDHDTEDGTIKTGHAVVVGHEPQANLTIDSQSDGTLCHVRCAFGVKGGAPIYMKAGSLWVQPVKDNTTDVHVNGVTPFDGELNATIGNVYINGTMKSVTAIDEAFVQINGTAANAKTIGGSSLYVKGNVTGTVTGEEKDGKSAALRVENPTNAQGVFETISGNGVITMSGDLTVNDVSNTKEIKGGTGDYALTLNGPEGKTFSNLTGSFRSISATDVDLILSGVVISEALNGTKNEILLNDDTRIGGNSNASCAAGTLTDSVLYIEDGANPQVYIRLTGVGESEVHMDAKAAASNSKIGLEGTFKSVTGKAYMFGDLTINSTVEETPVYGKDGLVLIGGMRAYSDFGLSHKLTLTDAAGNASVKLASDRDGTNQEVSAGFRAILVEDIYTDSAVKLTMNETVEENFAETKAINIGEDSGAGDDKRWDINALEVVGDKNTEVELRTNAIFGKVNGVDARAGENADGQPTVKLTGTPGEEKCTLIGDKLKAGLSATRQYGTGVVVDKAVVTLENYNVTGFVDGMNIGNGAVVTLKNVDVTPRVDGSTAEKTAAIRIDSSRLTLQGANSFTGWVNGVYSTDSTVTGEADSTGSIRTEDTANANCALYAEGGSVDLTNYTIWSKYIGVYAVKTAKTGDNLPDTTVSLTGCEVTGGTIGLNAAEGAAVTLSGCTVSGDTAAKVTAGKLYLKGENSFYGEAVGVLVQSGGVMTNVGADLGGSGKITADSDAGTILDVKGEGTRVELNDYDIVPPSSGAASTVGLLASDKAEVTLTATAMQPTLRGNKYALWAEGGATVKIDGAQNYEFRILKQNENIETIQICDATVYLGQYVVVTNLSKTAKKNIVGVPGAARVAKLYVAQENVDGVQENTDGMLIEGSFANLTGQQFTMSGDLTVDATAKGEWKDHGTFEGVSLLGKAPYNLALGAVDAELKDGSELKTLTVNGEDKNEAKLAVAGKLTVENANAGTTDAPAYGIKATHAAIELKSDDDKKPLTVTVTGANAAALDLGAGAELKLQGTVNVTASGTNGVGMNLTGDAEVKNVTEKPVAGKIYGTKAGLRMRDASDVTLTGKNEKNEKDEYVLQFEGSPVAIDIDDEPTATLTRVTARTDALKGAVVDSVVKLEGTGTNGVTFDNSIITHDSHTSDSSALIDIRGGSKVTFRQSAVQAKTNSPAMFISGNNTNVTVDQSTIGANKAGVYAVTLEEQSSLHLKASTISADGCDGAIRVAANSEVDMIGGKITINDASKKTVNLYGSMWIREAEKEEDKVQIDGVVFGATADDIEPKLYTDPALGGKVTVNGTFASITGTATVADGGNLVIGSTEDAKMPGATETAFQYANGKTTEAGANNAFDIVGGGTAENKIKVTQATGDVTVSGGVIDTYDMTADKTTVRGGEIATFTMKPDAESKYGVLDVTKTPKTAEEDPEIKGTITTLNMPGGTTTVTGGAVETFHMGDGTTTVSDGTVTTLNMTDGDTTVSGGAVTTFNMDAGTTEVSGGTVTTLNMKDIGENVTEATGTTTVSGGTVTTLNMTDGRTDLTKGTIGAMTVGKESVATVSGGNLTTEGNEVSLSGLMWITKVDKVEGKIAGVDADGVEPMLFIDPTLVNVNVDGTFASITGAAKVVAGGDLVIGSTVDEPLPDGAETPAYAGGADANDAFEIIGGGLETDKADVTQTTGNVTISGGVIGAYTMTDGKTDMTGGKISDMSVAAGTVTVTGGTLTDDTDKTVELGGSMWLADVTAMNGKIVGAEGSGLYINPALANHVTVDGAFASITGAAKVAAGGDLVIGGTEDAPLPDGAETPAYVGGEEPIGTFEIVGGGTAESKAAVTQKAGSVTVSDGMLDSFTLEDGDAVLTDANPITNITAWEGSDSLTVEGATVTGDLTARSDVTQIKDTTVGETLTIGAGTMEGVTTTHLVVEDGEYTVPVGMIDGSLTVGGGNVKLVRDDVSATLNKPVTVTGGSLELVGTTIGKELNLPVNSKLTLQGNETFVGTVKVNEDGQCTLPTATKSGYNFTKWRVKDSDPAVMYDAGGKAVLDNVVLEATFTEKINQTASGTVTGGGGAIVLPAQKEELGSLSGNVIYLNEINQSKIEELNVDEEVIIDLSKNVKTADTVAITKKTVANIATSGAESMTIDMPNTVIHMEAETLDEINRRMDKNQVQITVSTGSMARGSATREQLAAFDSVEDPLEVMISVTSAGRELLPFAGEPMEVTIPTDKAGGVTVWRVKTDGTMTKVDAATGNGSVTFAVTEAGYFVLERPENWFIDVSKDAYFYDAVIWAVENGITKGTSDTTFSPFAVCSRAQAVTFLYRAAGSPEVGSVTTFKDVLPGSYYEKAVAWAVENGITKGTSDTTFSPNETCSRAQIVTLLARFKNAEMDGEASFVDVPTNAFYTGAVAWAVAEGITNGAGDGTTFYPNADCTRGQIVTFLYRASRG